MPQPNRGSAAPSAPTQAPWRGPDGSKPNGKGEVKTGAPGGKGTKGK